jgi:hypothetical protein
MPIEPVDLLHLGNERVIGVYVVETPEGPALFDCGPATSCASNSRSSRATPACA